jgi:hypothetical protein
VGIVVACRCGQAFEADAWLAGKVVQCPSCHSPIAVPTPVPEATPAFVPRPRAAVSRQTREATESVAALLLAGVAILMAVLGISTTIICYLNGWNPLGQMKNIWEVEEQTPQHSAEPELVGPVPITGPDTAGSVPAQLPPGGSPEGWRFFEHPTARFGALLPGSIEVIERTIETVAGDNVFFILAASQEDHYYEASRQFRTFKIAPGGESITCDAIIKKRVEELVGGKIEATASATIDGRLVCDARIHGNTEGMEVRKYLRLIAFDDSVFELSCRVPPGKERSAEIEAFLRNYRLR